MRFLASWLCASYGSNLQKRRDRCTLVQDEETLGTAQTGPLSSAKAGLQLIEASAISLSRPRARTPLCLTLKRGT